METTLTILAPGSHLRSDIERYGVVGDVMAVSSVIADYSGPIKYAVCWYDKYLKACLDVREARCFGTEGIVAYTRPLRCQTAINNSGLLALSLAQDMKEYTEVRVLGMYADRSGHYYDLLPDNNDLDKRFTFGVTEWEDILPQWTKIKVSGGTLLKYFKQL